MAEATDEGVLDPWVAEWLSTQPAFALREIYQYARGDIAPYPVTREMRTVTDEQVDGIPIRIYEPDGGATGLIVYFHGGGMCVGSVSIMDNVARELAHAGGATVISVEYRLAPEHPYPAGLDDCEAVTRWAVANTARFGVDPTRVIVAGESAGGTFTAAVTLRLRDAGGPSLAGQLLIYPGVGGGADTASRREFAGKRMSAEDMKWCWSAYAGDRDLSGDPHAIPLHAETLAGLPAAYVMLGGCDFLRDEGREYAARLRADGVDTVEICHPGQIHGFMNHMHPAAPAAYAHIGSWIRSRLA